MDLLKATSARLAAAKSMSFTATVGYEYPSKLGPPIVYTTRYDVTMQRPDKLRVIVPGDGPASEFYYDGKAMIAYAPADELAAMSDAPPTIDAALAKAFETAAIYYPFAELVAADPYAALSDGAILAFYIGPSGVVAGTKTDMVAWANDDVFMQAWIGVDDKLPRRIRAVFRADPLGLRHEMELVELAARSRAAARTRSLRRRRSRPDAWRSPRPRRRRRARSRLPPASRARRRLPRHRPRPTDERGSDESTCHLHHRTSGRGPVDRPGSCLVAREPCRRQHQPQLWLDEPREPLGRRHVAYGRRRDLPLERVRRRHCARVRRRDGAHQHVRRNARTESTGPGRITRTRPARPRITRRAIPRIRRIRFITRRSPCPITRPVATAARRRRVPSSAWPLVPLPRPPTRPPRRRARTRLASRPAAPTRQLQRAPPTARV